MKKLLHFSLLFSFSLGAQNWSPVSLTDKYNYRLDNDAVVTQTIWQENYSTNGMDTTFHYNKISCDTCINISGGPASCNTCYVQDHSHVFFGYSLVKNASGWTNFRNPGSRTINLNAVLNDTWLFDTTNNVTAQVIFTGIATVIGFPDSVKTVLLSTGDTVQYSENFGITIWPNGYGQSSYFRLVGIHGRNIGVLVPRMTDYFDFQIGDMFEYFMQTGSCAATSTQYTDQRKYTITGVQHNGDTTIYQAHGLHATSWVDWQWPITSGGYNGPLNYTITVINYPEHLGNCFNHNVVESENRTLALWCNETDYYGQGTPPLSGTVFNTTHLFVDSLGVESIGLGTDVDMQDVSYQQDLLQSAPGSDTLYGGMGNMSNTVILKKGLGQVSGYYSCHFECYYNEYMVAYRKGMDTVGVFTPDNLMDGTNEPIVENQHIKVFPNPASESLNIRLRDDVETEISITDLQGRIIRRFNKMSGPVVLDVSDLSNGIYLLVASTSDVSSQQKIVISH
jgi:hypothetical protein